ncbi:D-alanyl-D-alanine carboxypeptidase family protein [Desulfuribacillus alkaliarsenatis]|uniref:serine-type D-Ala-D-Ala carboxypeptidase n=1 Tax=Desulfuribacillus alkaliarsenatis TaxID=766136 RepID=A0A1E5G5L5_9FIRM|nr:D-alanyl-D-alanine carboxypeptidase family protein [Desulfuribacillus alkaliarsenatis]OEF98480.1 D-alanyl-D-alanine carboxypeptidase [Desulfuribacillus alkaliarsenatis]
MKRYIKILTIKLLCLSLLFSGALIVGAETQSNQAELASNAKSAILMDVNTGTVLFEKNSHVKLPPASITKVMSLILIMEALEQGVISLTDSVTASENASKMGGSQIFLATNEQMTVKELLTGIAVVSGNDATVAMAEHLAGTEAEFVKMMNQKAKELGLKNTNFTNSHGLPDSSHYTTAYDIAIMSRELLTRYPEITEYTKIYSDYLRQDSDRPLWLVNTNRLVKFYEGADGLKTGYTSEAKYCLSATAKRDDLRVLAVVMGEPTSTIRNKEISEMFNYAFSKYKSEPIVRRGQVVENVFIDKGETNTANVVAENDMHLLLKKSENSDDYIKETYLPDKIIAPINQNEPIGYMTINKGNQEIARVSLVLEQDVQRAGFIQLLARTTEYWFGANID